MGAGISKFILSVPLFKSNAVKLVDMSGMKFEIDTLLAKIFSPNPCKPMASLFAHEQPLESFIHLRYV